MDADLNLKPPLSEAAADAQPHRGDAGSAPQSPPRRSIIRRRLALPGVGLIGSERRLLLAIVDLLLLFSAFVMTLRLRTNYFDPPGAMLALWRWFLVLAIVWWFTSQLTDAYDLALAGSAPHSILAAGGAAGLTVAIYQVVPFFTPPVSARSIPVMFGVLAVASISLWRSVYAVAFVQPAFQRRLLVLGAGTSGTALARAIMPGALDAAPNPYRGTGYHIVGFIDDDPAKRGSSLPGGAVVLGDSLELLKLAREHLVDEVVLAITQRDGIRPATFDALLACREQGFQVTTMQTLYERVLNRIPVMHVGRNISAILPVEDRGSMARVYMLSKRVVDIVVATVALVPLAVLVPIVALANAVSSPGPLFYRQTRIGRGGAPFRVFKFRTMRPDAELATGAVWARANDDRVTPIGRFLRRSRLDELPQVLNVFGGSMSLIGPRPERPEFVDFLAAQLPFYRARHVVRPGITGWAQIRFGYAATVDDARTKLEYDLYYVRHQGFYLDALIFLKTAAVVLRLQGK